MQPPFDAVAETKLAMRAIAEATKKVLEIYRGDFEASEKEDKSPLTVADIESHDILTKILSESGIPIISEEGVQQKSPSKSRFWLVDPLDGTREFVDKNGEFTIMVALVDDHRPSIGVISHPLANMVYVSQRGQGAFRVDHDEWTKLRVSDITTFQKARAVISRSHVSEAELEFIESLKLAGYYKLGSSLKALKICSGDAELYLAANKKIKQWDTCASYCLVTESGGRMTDMFGIDIEYNTAVMQHERGVVISNGPIHDEFIKKCEGLRARQIGSL